MGRSHTKDRRKRSRSRSPHRSENNRSKRYRSHEYRQLSNHDDRDSKRHDRVRDNSTNSYREDKYETPRERYVFQQLMSITAYLQYYS